MVTGLLTVLSCVFYPAHKVQNHKDSLGSKPAGLSDAFGKSVESELRFNRLLIIFCNYTYLQARSALPCALLTASFQDDLYHHLYGAKGSQLV